QIREPNVFIVDDVAFIYPEAGLALAREIERRGVHKQYYLETRGDVLLRNKEGFHYWKRLGLTAVFKWLRPDRHKAETSAECRGGEGRKKRDRRHPVSLGTCGV